MPMSTITQEDLISHIESMSVLELADLVKVLEDKCGVSAAGMMMAAPAAAGGAETEAEAEQTEFKVTLMTIGPQKIAVIKAVRALTGLGLKEAKAVVDAAPKVVKEGISREEADEISKDLIEAGAEVEVG